MFNKSFYPTPKKLIEKHILPLIDWDDVAYILEPSAGKGDILDALKEDRKRGRRLTFHAVEKEPELQDILRGKNYTVVGQDFLDQSAGNYSYDLIIMNPPFENGAEHLLKAIELLYSGQIVCILNAETIRNPYSNIRKLLNNRLQELEATIEFIPDAFKDAERKTNVEVALIYIKIEKDFEVDLLGGAKDIVKEFDVDIEEEDSELVTSDKIKSLVQEYEDIKRIGTEAIIEYFKKYKKLGNYLHLLPAIKLDGYSDPITNKYIDSSLNEKVKWSVNNFLSVIREDYWAKAFSIDAISNRLTGDRSYELHEQLQKKRELEFTANNIYSVISNLILNYEDTLNKTTLDIFDSMTCKYAWHPELHNKNVHYFNGWKTNDAFKVNRKVILPLGGFEKRWKEPVYDVSYDTKRKLNDIDKVMNFFGGLKSYTSMINAIEKSLYGQKKIESTFFIIDIYKKGTIHLTFRDEEMLKKLNFVACKEKKWLPQDYGKKSYAECSKEERKIIDSYEGQEEYGKFRENIDSLYAVQEKQLIGQ